MPLEALVAEEDRAEAIARYRLLRQRVDEAPLPPAYREAFEAVCLKGMTHREAAERLGITPGLLRTRLQRARVRIRNHIASKMN